MDQKRLLLAFALSALIFLGFEAFMPKPPRPAVVADSSQTTPAQTAPRPSDTVGATPQDAGLVAVAPAANAPRLRIAGTRVDGSISLLGGRIDSLVLKDYRETIDPASPQVRLLEARGDPQPTYAQFGWTGAAGVRVPDPNTTLWTADSEVLTPAKPVTLTWDNGAGLVFAQTITLDDNYMFDVRQSVRNTGSEPAQVVPWSRIRRDYTPEVGGYYILHEGLLGVIDGRLREVKYADAKTEGAKNNNVAFTATAADGWAGITDKYWLIALIPDAAMREVAAFRHTVNPAEGKQVDGTQVDFANADATTVAPGAEAAMSTHLFAGAKEVHLLDRYEAAMKIPNFDKAVDFGWFYFLTKPFFLAIDFLNGVFGNFGLAILGFTFCLKLLFFPLANKSYRSMSKMKLLGPKMALLKERYADDKPKLQSEMMQLYKTEKVNPASGCLPMLIQIPVFFSLYKVIFVTIEMRQAPFFGWIHDLSAIDPTNVFNLFGLLPFDPAALSPLLHLGLWPLIMGCTMFLQQKLNPPPPDPVQAKLFQFMPIIFTFMLARFPAGLVIYWSWNNTLTIIQQWFIMRQTRLAKPAMIRT